MTESGFMDMTPCFCSFRKKLDENNIQFIIDDFGTGYSNLRYISEMNPDYVKIDKDFTAMAMRSAKDHELFRKIIEMVHSVNIKICIEGIERYILPVGYFRFLHQSSQVLASIIVSTVSYTHLLIRDMVIS